VKIGMMWSWTMPTEKGAKKEKVKVETLPLAEHIKVAIEYYTEKYGRTPNACEINPVDIQVPFTKKELKELGLKIVPSGHILKGCIWLGIDE